MGKPRWARFLNPPGKRFRWGRWLLWVAAIIALAMGGASCVGCVTLNHEIRTTPRNRLTGVVLGVEELDINPPKDESPTSACLLLHGWIGSRRDFADLGERLAAAGYHVRMARLPGHGTTPREFASQTSESLYEGTLSEYRYLRDRYADVTVIGFSMGGSLATLLASREEMDRLVLIAPYYGVTYQWYYGLPPETWGRMVGSVIPYMVRPKGMVRVNRPGAAEQIYSYRTFPTRGVRSLVQLGKEARQDTTLTAVRCPVLVVMSKGDEAASPKRVQTAFEKIGSNRKSLVWFSERSNHHLLWDYDGEAAKETILSFLTRRDEEVVPPPAE